MLFVSMKCKKYTMIHRQPLSSDLSGESRARSHGGAPVKLPWSEHVDDVGQEHKADDGEEHQQQHIQHDARRAAGPGDAQDARCPPPPF